MASTVQLGPALSDGSYWSLNLHITEPPSSPPPPPEGFLTIDLHINRTRRVVFQDEHGNPSFSHEFGLYGTLVPTGHFPGTMTRAQYSSAMHQWLESLHLNELCLDGDDVVTNFTDHVINRLFARSVNLHNDKLAICIVADLRRVSLEFEPYSIESEQDQDDDEVEEYEEEEGLSEYEDEECVEDLIDYYAVVAAEKHRRFGDCSICLDGLFPVEEEGKKYLFESPCGHFFHGKCMTKWLRRSDSCPLCRFVMSYVIEE